MRLICAACGNYTFFEGAVETVRIVTPTSQGLVVKDQDEEGIFDAGGWIRIGLTELVEQCERQDGEDLDWDLEEKCYVNGNLMCARCGSRRVSRPYSPWSPPRVEQSLEEEIHQNRNDWAWLRKERSHADQLPGMP